jgi:hypothetical protein
MSRVGKVFLISGAIGVCVALVLYASSAIPILGVKVRMNPYIMLVLVPASILGLAEPTTLRANLLLIGIVLSTNFFLYGVVGLALFAVSWVVRFSSARS